MSPNLYLLLFCILFSQCSSPKKESESTLDRAKNEAVKGLKNGLFFHRIDDKVLVYVNNSLVFESDILAGQENINLILDLDEHINSPDDILKLVLINNKDCPGCDYSWQVLVYELYKNGEPEDYMVEDEPAIDNFGEVWEIEYVWGEI